MVHENDSDWGVCCCMSNQRTTTELLRLDLAAMWQGCDFGLFFDGRTPQDLLHAGIYNDLAIALYSGAFWPVSVTLVAKALGAVETWYLKIRYM